jgi:hypothetical protein
VELALKSVLVYHKVPELEITRSMGHRLTALLERAEQVTALLELGISQESRRFLDEYSEDYSAKWFEYPSGVEPHYPPDMEDLKTLVRAVNTAVQNYEKNRPQAGALGAKNPVKSAARDGPNTARRCDRDTDVIRQR